MDVSGIGNVSRYDMSRVRRSTAAATAGSPSRGIIARRALNVLAWGASGGTAFARA